jgi:DNA-binding LytR/AlgR family response regulator
MNCLIADDNELALIMLNSLIAQTKNLTVVAKCRTALEAFDYLKDNTVDIAFLDVEMPGMTAIELIKALPRKPVVVLLTANPAYATDAFDLNVADYIVKPATLARLLQAIEKARALLNKEKPETNQSEQPFLFIKEKNVLKKIMLNDILFIEAMGDYIKIHCTDKWYTASSSLRAMEEKYSQYFLKVHRSYLVAVSKIESIDESVINIGKNMIPVAESFRKKLLEKLDLM